LSTPTSSFFQASENRDGRLGVPSRTGTFPSGAMEIQGR
jgi:hypothetical protein